MIQPSKAVSMCNSPFSLLFYCLQKLYPKPMLDQGHSPTKGRCIALYPGAFRPPHAAHYFAVRYLLTQPHIDEVVVIISNRCRPIAGTTLALDATIAQQIWSLYLRGIKKVRVEVAPLTAVGHAFEYFDHSQIGDTLFFCLGEADISQGDDRFRNLKNLSKQFGIQAHLIQAPTASLPIRSTSLRAALFQGCTGQEEFMAALPTHLIDKERKEVWEICQKGMREMGDVMKGKVHAFLMRTGLGKIQDLRITDRDKMDPVFRARLKEGRCLFVKYAGDALGTEEIGNAQNLKPRQRLSVERKALKWLRAHMQDGVKIPEVICFEKKTWTLVLTEVCPNGNPLQNDLQKGIFNPTLARKASQFLAECHTIPHQAPPLWGAEETDRQHWKRILSLRTTGLASEEFSKDLRNNLETLQLASEAAEENRFMHLDFHPKNILIAQESIGVIDFELSSSIGDPAFDLGTFLGHYIYWILAAATDHTWESAIQHALQTYQRVVGELWKRMDSRVVGFTGAALLHIPVREDERLNRVLADKVLQTGTFLLAQGMKQHGDAKRILCETINDFSR